MRFVPCCAFASKNFTNSSRFTLVARSGTLARSVVLLVSNTNTSGSQASQYHRQFSHGTNSLRTTIPCSANRTHRHHIAVTPVAAKNNPNIVHSSMNHHALSAKEMLETTPTSKPASSEKTPNNAVAAAGACGNR